MVLMRGYGRPPKGEEAVVLKDGWEQHIPDTNDGLPVGFPRVENRDLTVSELQDWQAEQLGHALEAVEAETGIGPWDVTSRGVGGCGPVVTGHKTGDRTIGSSPYITMQTGVTPTDEQYFEVIGILDRFYPGIAEKENQRPGPDEVGARG